jgi:hypothetical protein
MYSTDGGPFRDGLEDKQMNRQTERDTRQSERNGKVSRQTESYEDRQRNRHTKIKLTYGATGRKNTIKHIIGLTDGHTEIWTQIHTMTDRNIDN